MDKDGTTPLLQAADSASAICIRLLLEAGANPDPTIPRGIFHSTALTAAAQNANTLAIKTLLDFNAKTEDCGPEG